MKGMLFSYKDKTIQAVLKDGVVIIQPMDYVRGVPNRVFICRNRLWKGLKWYIRAYKHLF